MEGGEEREGFCKLCVICCLCQLERDNSLGLSFGRHPGLFKHSCVRHKEETKLYKVLPSRPDPKFGGSYALTISCPRLCLWAGQDDKKGAA